MIHGGDIYTVAELTGKDLSEIIDLSSSVTPLPLPAKIKDKLIEKFDFLNKYPDIEARSFKKTLSAVYNIPIKNIICGNGSTELIYLSIRALKPSKVLILEPTFVEYERACKVNRVKRIDRVFSLNKDELIKKALKKIKHQSYDVVFICNPNNPTGWLIEKKDLLFFARLSDKTIFIIDEAFIDFVPEESVIYEALKRKNLLILRSLTKFYGLAGLRLGYAVGSFELVEKLKKFKEPWSINTLACCAGEEIIKDETFKEETLKFFNNEKRFFEKVFKELNLKYFPSVANFYLIKLSKEGLVDYMLKKGILIRDCSNFYRLNRQFIRISIKTRKENEIFFKELKNWLKISY